tara:strand:- start:763 stop:1155 length:393 start_codon:yes stop_codon:yes gene_type:complete
MTLEGYVDNLNQRYKLGNATEHTYRVDLGNLLETLLPDVRATNEPKRQSCGAPDYILTKKEIPVGFIEAKNIGKEIYIAFIEDEKIKVYNHDEAVSIIPDNIKNSNSWVKNGGYSWGKTPKKYDAIIKII